MNTFTHLLSAAALPLLVVGGGTFTLIKFADAKIWHALLLLIGGFYLAKSPLAPYIGTFLARIPGLFGVHLHLSALQAALAVLAPARPGALTGEVRRP